MVFETYLLYLAAVAVFFATPPDTSQLLIVSNSVRHGLRRSAYTIAGDLTANSLQMTGAAFGLAAIIATSASAFIWIKWLGVAYLVWIGIQLILSREQSDHILPQLLILGTTYLIVDGAILLLWGWLGVRAAIALKGVSFGRVNKVCGTLMIAAAALLASKDFQPQK